MNTSEFNSAVRALVHFLKNEYDLKRLCAVTLGTQSKSTLTRFLNGSDLGHLPMGRFLESLGYELHFVPIHITDEKFKNELEERSNKFIDESKDRLVNYMNDKPSTPRKSSKKKLKSFDNIWDQLQDDNILNQENDKDEDKDE